MANFTKSVKIEYKRDSYQDIQDLYDCIQTVLNNCNFSDYRIQSRFLFSVDDILCSCSNVEEFIENAYGCHNFFASTMEVTVFSGDKCIAAMGLDPLGELRISSDSKVILQKIEKALQFVISSERAGVDGTTSVYIEHQSTVQVTGSNNIVANGNSSIQVDNNSGVKESKGRQWVRVIIQNLISNGIWYILGALAFALCRVLLMKQ